MDIYLWSDSACSNEHVAHVELYLTSLTLLLGMCQCSGTEFTRMLFFYRYRQTAYFPTRQLRSRLHVLHVWQVRLSGRPGPSRQPDEDTLGLKKRPFLVRRARPQFEVSKIIYKVFALLAPSTIHRRIHTCLRPSKVCRASLWLNQTHARATGLHVAD